MNFFNFLKETNIKKNYPACKELKEHEKKSDAGILRCDFLAPAL